MDRLFVICCLLSSILVAEFEDEKNSANLMLSECVNSVANRKFIKSIASQSCLRGLSLLALHVPATKDISTYFRLLAGAAIKDYMVVDWFIPLT
jgi:hypothetical protein